MYYWRSTSLSQQEGVHLAFEKSAFAQLFAG
ncbi:hypothetical protein [Methylicorpusculum sp.]